MIIGGIIIGNNRPYNLVVGTNPVLDIFYKNDSLFQSIFTHWGETNYTTWGSQGVYTWRQEVYAQESDSGVTSSDNNNYVGNIVMGTAFL